MDVSHSSEPADIKTASTDSKLSSITRAGDLEFKINLTQVTDSCSAPDARLSETVINADKGSFDVVSQFAVSFNDCREPFVWNSSAKGDWRCHGSGHMRASIALTSRAIIRELLLYNVHSKASFKAPIMHRYVAMGLTAAGVKQWLGTVFSDHKHIFCTNKSISIIKVPIKTIKRKICDTTSGRDFSSIHISHSRKKHECIRILKIKE